MHFFSILMNLSTLVFVVTSMLAMGLSLTVAQIVAPLRNPRVVLAALAANFLLAPALAYAIGSLLALSDVLRFSLILVSTAVDAPFLPRLVDLSVLLFTANLMGRRTYDLQPAG